MQLEELKIVPIDGWLIISQLVLGKFIVCTAGFSPLRGWQQPQLKTAKIYEVFWFCSTFCESLSENSSN